jgi:hypothetical protein
MDALSWKYHYQATAKSLDVESVEQQMTEHAAFFDEG